MFQTVVVRGGDPAATKKPKPKKETMRLDPYQRRAMLEQILPYLKDHPDTRANLLKLGTAEQDKLIFGLSGQLKLKIPPPGPPGGGFNTQTEGFKGEKHAKAKKSRKKNPKKTKPKNPKPTKVAKTAKTSSASSAATTIKSTPAPRLDPATRKALLERIFPYLSYDEATKKKVSMLAPAQQDVFIHQLRGTLNLDLPLLPAKSSPETASATSQSTSAATSSSTTTATTTTSTTTSTATSAASTTTTTTATTPSITTDEK